MSRLTRCLLLLLLVGLCAPAPPAAGVAYYPLVHQDPGDETLARPGTTVYLFHSGTEDARRTLHVGDVLTVVRVQNTCESVDAGIVRIVAFIGDTYLKAEVVSGAVKPNDIAKAGSVSCLVLSAQPCDRR
jgi:flagellar basal body L-ring protein FlgH